MKVLSQLEKSPRSFYTGNILFLDALGRMDSNILIRTLLVNHREVVLQVGGGIVDESLPQEELQETRDKISVNYFLNDENLDSDFEISDGVIIPAGDYSFDQYCLNVETAEYRKISVMGNYCGGEFFGGNQDSAGVKILWRPNRHFKIAARFDFNEFDLPFGSFKTKLLSLRADIAFTNTWSWENYLQYDDVSDTFGINSILRYVPRAGREIVLVMNREYVDPLQDRDFEIVYSDLTFKFSYTFRF